MTVFPIKWPKSYIHILGLNAIPDIKKKRQKCMTGVLFQKKRQKCIDKMSISVLTGYLQTVQATMTLATILCCVGFFVFILQLFRLKKGERFIFTAVIQLLSCKFQ